MCVCVCTLQVVPGAGSEEELLGCHWSVVPGLRRDRYVVHPWQLCTVRTIAEVYGWYGGMQYNLGIA